ncbi:transcriptional repressor TCF25-domain-containing protein [Lactarius quietus]|nr:transcriptional repressor TCF25-domain-containing protein [Lactarius quietus]
MLARLSKRQQRELQELAHANEIEQARESSDDDVRFASTHGQSAFAALLGGDEDREETEEESAPEGTSPKAKKYLQCRSQKSKKKKKKKGLSAPPDVVSPVGESSGLSGPSTALAEASSSAGPSASSPSPGGTSKKEWKALKKQKAKAKRDGNDEFDKALEELSIKYRDMHSASSATTHGQESSPRPLQDECSRLLSVSLSHLSPDAEMRKFFGSKVISASKNEPGSSSRARRQPTTQRSNLTRPRSNWWPAKLREGLTLRPLTANEVTAKDTRAPWNNSEEKYWTAEYSKRYKGATLAFMQTVLSGDPEGFYAILQHVPWHADTLLQLAEVYSHREEHSQAADFIERALFTYERAFVGAFTFTNGLNRLDFDRVENRPFYLALHRHVIDLQRRGIYRTAFEFARLLLSLDPWSDPHGVYLHLDFLAIKSGMQSWLLSFSQLFAPTVSKASELEESQSGQMPIVALPGWAYARALALKAEGDENASQALKQAVLDFPSIVPLLADKAEIALSAEVRSQPAFRIYTRPDGGLVGESLLHLLSLIYVQRSHALWKDPSRSSWFAETVTELVRTGQLPPKVTSTNGFVRIRSLVRRDGNFELSVYRHVVVLGPSAQTFLHFIPAHVIDGNNLACDPLPPPSSQSRYDDDFFRGAEDAFATSVHRRRGAAQTQRLLERLIPDPVFRGQLQDFFEAHPRLLQLFPGGVIQFAQHAVNMPEEVLQELMVNAQMMGEVAGAALPHGEMPGGLPGDNLVRLDFLEEGGGEDAEPAPANVWEAIPAPDRAPPLPEDEDEEEDEDEDEEEIAPLPIRVLRNFVGRFWGGNNAGAEEEPSSDEGSQRETELDGVD